MPKYTATYSLLETHIKTMECEADSAEEAEEIFKDMIEKQDYYNKIDRDELLLIDIDEWFHNIEEE